MKSLLAVGGGMLAESRSQQTSRLDAQICLLELPAVHPRHV